MIAPKTVRRRRRVPAALSALPFLAPSLTGLILFVLIPFAEALIRSVKNAFATQYVGMDNYIAVLQNEAFRHAGLNTLRFVAVCIPILLFVSLAIALLSHAAGRRAQWVGATFLLPMAIPVSSVALIWQVVFAQGGFLNRLMHVLGGIEVDWLNSPSAFYVLVFTYVWRNAGYNMVLWEAGLAAIDPGLYEAAQVDGAGALRRFFHITLPILLPTLFTITVLSLLNSFKVFREAYLIAGSYPNDSMYMLQNLFNNWYTNLDVQKLSAAAVLVALVIFLLVMLLQRLWGKEEV